MTCRPWEHLQLVRVNYAMEGGARGLPMEYVHVFLDEWSGQGPGNCFQQRGKAASLGSASVFAIAHQV